MAALREFDASVTYTVGDEEYTIRKVMMSDKANKVFIDIHAEFQQSMALAGKGAEPVCIGIKIVPVKF